MMKNDLLFRKANYDAMYRQVLEDLARKHPNPGDIYVRLSREEYADYLALAWCRQAAELENSDSAA